MRIIAIILSLTVFALSALPCCAVEQEIKNIIEVNTDDCSDSAPCTELCSPFFACSGCTGFTVLSGIRFEMPRPVVTFQKWTSFNKLLILSDFPIDVWQPPRD